MLFPLKCDFTPSSENVELEIYPAKFSLNQSFATKYLEVEDVWNLPTDVPICQVESRI